MSCGPGSERGKLDQIIFEKVLNRAIESLWNLITLLCLHFVYFSNLSSFPLIALGEVFVVVVK